MEREAPFFLRARSCRSRVERLWIAKFPQGPERSARSLAALALRVFTGVSLGFCWGFAGDLGSQTSQTLCKSSAKSLENRAQYPPKSAQTLQNRPQNLKKSRSGGGCDLDCFLSLFVRRLGASWGRLGASWGRLGAVLGRPGGVLGASWGVLEPSWGVLEPSWASSGRLGASPRF